MVSQFFSDGIEVLEDVALGLGCAASTWQDADRPIIRGLAAFANGVAGRHGVAVAMSPEGQSQSDL